MQLAQSPSEHAVCDRSSAAPLPWPVAVTGSVATGSLVLDTSLGTSSGSPAAESTASEVASEGVRASSGTTSGSRANWTRCSVSDSECVTHSRWVTNPGALTSTSYRPGISGMPGRYPSDPLRSTTVAVTGSGSTLKPHVSVDSECFSLGTRATAANATATMAAIATPTIFHQRPVGERLGWASARPDCGWTTSELRSA